MLLAFFVDEISKPLRRTKIPSISARKRARIVKKTIEEKPPNATHWSRTSMAKATGVSDSTVGRIWRAHGLKPHLSGTFKLSNDKQFAEKLEDVVGLYLNPPENLLNVGKEPPIRPTVQPFVADQSTSPNGDPHNLDNYATHKHQKVVDWHKRNPRFHVHFTPTSASWLNMVERFFRDLSEQRLRRGVFHSVPELIQAVEDYVDGHNQSPKPFIWTAQASDILEKVRRARKKLVKVLAVALQVVL